MRDGSRSVSLYAFYRCDHKTKCQACLDVAELVVAALSVGILLSLRGDTMTRLLPLLLLSACAGDPFTLLLPDAGPALATPDPSTPDAGAEHVKPVEPEAGSSAQADSSANDSSSVQYWDSGVQDARREASLQEAASAQDSPVDVVSESYSLPDACTSFPSPITWMQSCDGFMATVPAYFFMIQSGPCTSPASVIPMGGQLATATPKSCQCRETYTCACLDEQGVCGAGKHATSCQPSPNANSEIVVNCN